MAVEHLSVTLPEVDKAQIVRLAEEASALQVTDHGNLILCETMLSVCDDLDKYVIDKYHDAKSSAWKAHKSVCAMENADRAMVQDIREMLTPKRRAYLDEQEALRVEQEAKHEVTLPKTPTELTDRKVWHAEITDLKTYLAAIVAGDLPLVYALKIDEKDGVVSCPAVNKRAQAEHDGLKIAGVKVDFKWAKPSSR